MGCYEDHRKRLLDGGKHGTNGHLTPERCRDKCKEGRYRFFGLESHDECFCGHNWHPDYVRQGINKEKRSESDCNKDCKGNRYYTCGGGWRINIYDMWASKDYILASKAGACSGGALSAGSFPITSEAECKKAAAQLAIVSGKYYGPDQTKGWNNRPGCSFDRSDKAYHWNPRPEARGKWGYSNYFEICSRVEIKDDSVPWTKPVPGAQYMGCIEDHRDRILKGFGPQEFPKTNKGTVCKGFCQTKGFKLFGVQSGDQCFCGNSLRKKTMKNGDCRDKCPGDSSEFCGGGWRMKVYEIMPNSDNYQVAAAITGCSLEEGSKVTTEEQCKLACQSMGKTFSAGTWDYCPGCFYYTGNENCHWNRRTNVKWNAKGNYEVCKKKEGDYSSSPMGEKCWDDCSKKEGKCSFCGKAVCCRKLKNKPEKEYYGNDGCTADVGTDTGEHRCVKPSTIEPDLSYIRGEDGLTQDNWDEVRKYFDKGPMDSEKNTWLSYRGMKWEGELTKEIKLDCGSGKAMYWLLSFFDTKEHPLWEKKLDRRWAFRCKDGVEPDTCTWSGYKNQFRQKMDLQCPDNYALSGLESIFDSNGPRDRMWKIKCCKVKDVKIPGEEERYAGLETIASGKCKKKLIAHRRGPMNWRADGRNFIAGLTEVNYYGQTTYGKSGSDDREWYVWECPHKFQEWCVIKKTDITKKINPPNKASTQVVGVASAIGCNPEVGYGIRLSQVNAIVNDVSYSVAKSKSSSFSAGWSIEQSAEIGASFNLGVEVGAAATTSRSYSGSTTATVSATSSRGETEGFSDGKYSLHLYMYKGPGATICWATRDHFNYKQEVTTKHHMKCNRQKDNGEIEYFDKTEESTAKVDGNTFGRLVFHSRTLEWNSTFANTPIADADLTEALYQQRFWAQCNQKLADCIQNLDHGGLATDWTGPAAQFEYCRQQYAKDAKTL